MILVTAQIPVKVRVHLSDDGLYMAASVEVMRIRLATIRAEIAKDRVRMRINGKESGEYSAKFGVPKAENARRALSVVRRARMVRAGSFSAYVGASDCALGALMWGACAVIADFLPARAEKHVYWDRNAARFSLDASLVVRASALQAARILFALVKKG